jgi:4-amino-4-deoxy-L-arabinose transferase-like glycosyltransferase
MKPMPRIGIVETIVLVLVLTGAAAARIGYLLILQGEALPIEVQDARGELLCELARNISEGRGYVVANGEAFEPVASPSPLYPLMLGQLLSLSPSEQAMRTTQQWIQCGLGVATVGLIALFARRAFRSSVVGLAAGTLCALHPFWIVNTAELDDGVLTAFLMALALFLGTLGNDSGGAFTSWAFGLALAGLALARAAMLPFTLVAMVWYLARCRRLPKGWMFASLAVLGFGSGLAPWSVRNLQVFDDVFPVVDTTYHHLWQGNHPGATGGPTDDAESAAACTDRELAIAIGQHLASDPEAALRHRLWAALYFVFGAEWFHGAARGWRMLPLDHEAWEEAPAPLASACSLLMVQALAWMVLLGLLGWRWSYAWRRESRLATLACIWVPVPYLLGHAEKLSGPRLPLDGILLSYAALALVCLLAPTWLVRRARQQASGARA